MPVTNFSPLLGLALPTTGDLSGTWGTTVNDSITSLLDTAVAGTTTLSTDADVTLSTTNGAANQARSSVLLCTGARTALRTITAPAQSKAYVVINATTGGFGVKVVGAGPTTGVTITNGERALIAWNGSDFVIVSSSIIDLTNEVTGTLPVANGGTGLTSGTSGGVLAFTASGTIASSNALTANAIVVGGGAGAAPSTITTGTGVTTAIGNAVNTTGGLVTQSGTLTSNNILLGGGASTAISSSNLLSVAAAVTTGNYIRSIGYADTVTALGNTGTAINLDVTSGGVFTATLTGNATITLRYPVATGSSSFTLILTNDGTAGRTVAWAGGNFRFPGGAASLSRTTTANAVDIWVFFTPDGGTTWYGNIAMKNMTA